MASVTSGIAKMIVQYEWILENVEGEPKTIASKMILFRGEKVFRVGLKNHKGGNEPPLLFVMAVDLNKMGMKVEGVTYGIQDGDINGPEKMIEMAQENIAEVSYGGIPPVINCGVLQLFTIKLAKQVTRNCKFVFRICIEGSGPGFSYRLSDRLAKDQLWYAAENQNYADVEFDVKDKTFCAHKAILAARSPVFAAEFTKEQQGNDQRPLQIQINGVEPSTFEQFLYFIYTGESKGTFANEELLKLALKYELTTLAGLCEVALAEIKPIQMVNLDRKLNKESEILTSSIIRPDKETEIFFDRTTPTFRCDWTFELHYNNLSSKCMMKYQNEDIFFGYITGKEECSPISPCAGCVGFSMSFVRHPWFHFLCAKHRSCGLKVDDIYLSDVVPKERNWIKMELQNSQKNEHLLHFISHSNVYSNVSARVSFDIKMVSTIGNYYYEMMDDAWMKDIWTAATSQNLTDVEIFVGTVKVMEAHRVILSARSPVMSTSLRKTRSTGKSTFTFGAEYDVEMAKNFFKFLYTGLLESSASNKQLLELATQYKVETLKNICQLANGAPLDVEEFTDSLLQLA